jgi:hypothetical protein
VRAKCWNCDFRQEERNAAALAAIHYQKTGHMVVVDEVWTTNYGIEDGQVEPQPELPEQLF